MDDKFTVECYDSEDRLRNYLDRYENGIYETRIREAEKAHNWHRRQNRVRCGLRMWLFIQTMPEERGCGLFACTYSVAGLKNILITKRFAILNINSFPYISTILDRMANTVPIGKLKEYKGDQMVVLAEKANSDESEE